MDVNDMTSLLQKESAYKPMHLPFHKYAGPGTKVFTNILSNVKPTTYLDRLALLHDIDYTDRHISQSDADDAMSSKTYTVLPHLAFEVNKILRLGKKSDYPEAAVNYMRSKAQTLNS